jgi:hypothetical protein
VLKLLVGPVSVTLNAPGFNVRSVPVLDPLKLAGVGLIPETCIAKSDDVIFVVPDTIFITVNEAVVGVRGGVGVV